MLMYLFLFSGKEDIEKWKGKMTSRQANLWKESLPLEEAPEIEEKINFKECEKKNEERIKMKKGEKFPWEKKDGKLKVEDERIKIKRTRPPGN